MLNPKNKSYFESINLGRHVNTNPFRIGQKGAFNCIVEKIMNGASTVSVVLPTRYGKSDVIRASAIELIERNVVGGCLIAAPCKYLRDQLTNKSKVIEMAKRYSIATTRPISYDILDNFRLPIFQNDEYFIALTTQMLSINADQICDYIRQFVKKTGKVFLVYIDESHSQSDCNTWGSVVPKIVSAGGAVVLCTATPFRDDGKKIPGFNYVIENKREKIRYVPRQHEDDSKYWLDIYNDIEGDMRLEADYEFPFKEAWAEKEVICKLSRIEFDVVTEIPDKEGMKEVKISEMTTTECSNYFGRVLRHEKVIHAGVKQLLDRLNDYRLNAPTAQAIVFCGNDIDGEDDGHAKQIASEIASQSPRFKVVIATSKQSKSDDLIKKFAQGNGDILIVKQMASLGLDIPSIKIGLDLSAVRTLAAFIQRMMRVATIWGDNQVAHLIIPSDVNGVALWNGFIEENGGNMTAHDSTKIDSVEKDKEEKDTKSKYMEVIRTESPIISDNFNSDQIRLNQKFKELIKHIPKLQSICTDIEIQQYASQIEFISDSPNTKESLCSFDVVLDITEQRELLRKEIKGLVNKIANIKFNYSTKRNLWEREVSRLYNKSKRAAGVSTRGNDLKKIVNIDKLNKMKNYLENELRSIS